MCDPSIPVVEAVTIDDKCSRLAYQLSRSISYGKCWLVEERLAWEFPYLAARLRATLPQKECPDDLLSRLGRMLRVDPKLCDHCFAYCSHITCGLSLVPFTKSDVLNLVPESEGRVRMNGMLIEVQGRDGLYRSMDRIFNTSMEALSRDVRTLLSVGVKPDVPKERYTVRIAAKKDLFSAILSAIPVGEWSLEGEALLVSLSCQCLSFLAVPFEFVDDAGNKNPFMGQGKLSCLVRFVRTQHRCVCLTFSDCRTLFGPRFSRLSELEAARLDPVSFKKPAIHSSCVHALKQGTFIPSEIHRLFSIKRFWSFAAVDEFIKSTSLSQFFFVDRNLDELTLRKVKKSVQKNLYGPNGSASVLTSVHHFILVSFGYWTYEDFCRDFPFSEITDSHVCTVSCTEKDQASDYICDNKLVLVEQMLGIRNQFLHSPSSLSDYGVPDSLTVSLGKVEGLLFDQFLRVQRLLRKGSFFSGRSYMRVAFKTINVKHMQGIICFEYVLFRYDESILLYRLDDSDHDLSLILSGHAHNFPGRSGFSVVRAPSEWFLVGQGKYHRISFVSNSLVSIMRHVFCRGHYDPDMVFPAFLSLFISPAISEYQLQEMVAAWREEDFSPPDSVSVAAITFSLLNQVHSKIIGSS